MKHTEPSLLDADIEADLRLLDMHLLFPDDAHEERESFWRAQAEAKARLQSRGLLPPDDPLPLHDPRGPMVF